LAAAIDAGAFRADLFYRLNVFPIEVPALRQRADDIPVLVEYFVRLYAQKAGKRIKNIRKRTLELFQTYDWPGNVRELQNVVERAVVLSNEETFFVDESWLKPQLRQQLGGVSADRTLTSAPLVTNLLEREKEIIETALREAKGVVGGPAGAAAKLGIPRETLNSKIRKLGIKRYLFKRS
jgi:formate hydrogenlyase transcriptional activator